MPPFPPRGDQGVYSSPPRPAVIGGLRAPPWITVTSGSGMGSGTMSYTVSPNTGSIRTAGLTIAGNVFTVTEAGHYLRHHRLRRSGRGHFPVRAGFCCGGGRTDLHDHPQYRLPDCRCDRGRGFTRIDYLLYFFFCERQPHHNGLFHAYYLPPPIHFR